MCLVESEEHAYHASDRLSRAIALFAMFFESSVQRTVTKLDYSSTEIGTGCRGTKNRRMFQLPQYLRDERW